MVLRWRARLVETEEDKLQYGSLGRWYPSNPWRTGLRMN